MTEHPPTDQLDPQPPAADEAPATASGEDSPDAATTSDDAHGDEPATGSSSPEHADGSPEATSADESADAALTSEAGSPDDAAPDAEDAAPEAGVLGPDGVPGDEDHLPPGQTEVPVGDEVVIDDDTMRRALEAILMVTDEPLPVLTLARAVGRPTGDVAAALGALSAEYTEQGRGFDLREIGGGWRYYTRPEAAAFVERFVLDGQQARLTQAALETLAVVAYKQPVSRARVSAIRGVNVDGVMRTLIARGLVEEAGSDTDSQATLYRTTSYFLERMGMQSLDDLPELAPYLPEMDDIEDELAAQSLPPEEPADGTTPAEPEEDPGPLENDLAPPVVTPADPGDDDEEEPEYVTFAPTEQVESDDSVTERSGDEPVESDGSVAAASGDERSETDPVEFEDGGADEPGDVATAFAQVDSAETPEDEHPASVADGAGQTRWYPYDQTAEEIGSADVPNAETDRELRAPGE
ncbi:SMC-Scp complex subunit ScpB [Kribbella sp. NPDC020789]